MQQQRHWTCSLVEAAQSIAFAVWIAAAVIIPAALLLRSYETALLAVILVFAWQLLAALLVWAFSVQRPPASRSRFRCRPTNWGVVYGGIAGIFCLVSLHWGINLLYVSAAFLLGGALCGAAWPWLMLARLTVAWELPEHVFAREPFTATARLRNAKRLFSSFGLWVGTDGGPLEAGVEPVAVSRLRAGQTASLPVQQYMPRRGLQRLQPLTARTTFPFGLLEAARRTQLRRELLVLPHVGHINADLMRRHGGGEAEWLMTLRRRDPEGEFHSLREYRPGDNPRLIHWPTSARLHKLYVREFERREQHSVLILLDAYAPPAGPAAAAEERLARFEKAVSFAATLAALLTRMNTFYAFASYCPALVALPYDVGRGHLFSVLETLALAAATPDHALSDLGSALGGDEMVTGGACLVTPGPAPAQASAALGPLAHRMVTVDVSRPEFDEIYSP